MQAHAEQQNMRELEDVAAGDVYIYKILYILSLL